MVMVVESMVWIINNVGVINRKVKFSGLVILINMLVMVVGISNLVILVLFFGFVVLYIVNVIFKLLNIVLLFCMVKLLVGNSCFNGLVDWLNFCKWVS